MYYMPTKNKIGVIDLFCGIGGLSHGMYKEGLDIIAGFDIDDTCKYAYEKNNNSCAGCNNGSGNVDWLWK
jgi:DNA (cytosine-5)-methyltransferase 1